MPDQPAETPPSLPEPTGVIPAPPVPPVTESPSARPPLAGVALPLPRPDDTPADLLQTLEQQLHAAPAPVPATATEPPVIAPAAQPRESHPFLFHGEAKEYFRIWIVNTLLTLLTLGVYAAWAKVRKRRYLRGSTELMGHRFDYLADPRRILAGNILVAVMFAAYMVFGEVYPSVRIGALVVGIALLPWVVIRSLAFNAHNTAYRGMRFYARQTYGMAAMTFIGQWFIILITLGLYYPAWVRNRKALVISSHRLGDAFFRFESKSGPFYSAYLFSGLVVMGIAALGAMITGFLIAGNGGHPPTSVQLIPFLLLYGTAIVFSKHYIYARLFNHIWSNTRLDGHRFAASLPLGGWLKLQLVNLGAVIVSCGLLYPWAEIRSARYALGCLRFEPDRPIERISRLGRLDGSAFGETAAEFVGLDFGL